MPRKRKQPDPQKQPPVADPPEQGQVFQLQILDGFGATDTPVTAKNRVRQRIVVDARAAKPGEHTLGDVVAWTEPNTITTWAKAFGVHRATMTRYLRSQTIPNHK